jgi:histidine triad (HIT) family protein
MDCLFCKIANKQLPSNLVFENDQLIAFHDIAPKAPIHILIVPKKHIATINDLTEQETLLAGQMIQTAKQLAQQLNVAESGYRLIFNVNHAGGQEIYHLHLHLLATTEAKSHGK